MMAPCEARVVSKMNIATAHRGSSSDGFQAAYVSASCLQQSQLYCCRRFGGANLQLMFSLRSATEKAIISSDPDSAQKVFVAVVSEYGLALRSRQAVIGQLGQH